MLISWVGASVVFYLALLRAAARPAPCFEEEMTSGSKTALQREIAAVSPNARLASQFAKGAVPASCRAA
jgi:hypothetical protein